MNRAAKSAVYNRHGLTVSRVAGAPAVDQGDRRQAGERRGACVVVHGAQEEPPVVHDPPGHLALAAHRPVAPDQDPRLLQPHQHGHDQQPHPRDTRHVRVYTLHAAPISLRCFASSVFIQYSLLWYYTPRRGGGILE